MVGNAPVGGWRCFTIQQRCVGRDFWSMFNMVRSKLLGVDCIKAPRSRRASSATLVKEGYFVEDRP